MADSRPVALILVLFVCASSGVTPPRLWIGLDDSRFSCSSPVVFLSFLSIQCRQIKKIENDIMFGKSFKAGNA